MKIRIQDNSIRLRLTQSEVAKFQEHGKVFSKVQFPGANELHYGLVRSSGPSITATFSNDSVTVEVPAALGNTWADTEQVGFEESVRIEEGQDLQLLVEKDFRCSSRASEDKSDLFPNPLESDGS